MKNTFQFLLTLILVSTLYLPNTFAQYQDYMQLSLPEGAKARFGKGWISGDIAYSPDDTRLAVASSIGIWIYDTSTYAEIALLTGHIGAVNSVAYSPDGKTLISGGQDGSILVWDTDTSQLLHILEEHTSSVNSIAFSPDGKMFASGGSDWRIRLWDTDTGQLLRTIRMYKNDPLWAFGSASRSVDSVAFSHDGTMLAAGVRNNEIWLWDVNTWELLFRSEGHRGGVESVAFSSDGVTLASGDGDGKVQLWGARTGKYWQTLGEHNGSSNFVTFSPDGTILASGGGDAEIMLWDAFTGEHLRTLKGHPNGVLGVAFSPDGQTLASASWYQIRFWDVSTGQPLHTLGGGTVGIHSIALSPDGRTLATGLWLGYIWLLDVSTGQHKQTFKWNRRTDSTYIDCVTFSPDGTLLASGGRNSNNIYLSDIDTGKHKNVFIAYRSGINASGVNTLSFSPDGTILASGGADEHIRLWDVNAGQFMKSIETYKIYAGDRGGVNSLSFSPDGQTLACAAFNKSYGGIHIYHIRTGCQLKRLIHWSNFVPISVAFSPDGSILAGTVNNEIWLWNPRSGERVQALIGHTHYVRYIAFSPDGKSLVSVGNREIRLWDVETGDHTETFWGHTSSVNGVAFSPDGRTLISGSGDGTVLLWELAPTTPEPEKLTTDVNGDSVVNIQDLVLVASRLGQTGENDEDINGDGVVNIQDLVLVAAALGNSAAAPSMYSKASAMLSTPQVQKWLTQAQQLNLTDPTSQRGILFLEQLLAALTPKETALLPNFPNPFNPETWIPYQLAAPADVNISIYSADGQLIRTLVLGTQTVGIYKSRTRAAHWDGKNELGEPVASGVYFYTLTTGDFTATRKMLILK